MQALTNVKTLDWRGWRLGLWGAIVSGGAGSLGSFVGVEAVLDVGIGKTLAVVGITALASSLVSMGKFLHTHPIPDELSPTTTVTTVIRDQHAKTTTEVTMPDAPVPDDK